MRVRSLWVALILLAALAACSKSKTPTPPVAPPPPPPADTATSSPTASTTFTPTSTATATASPTRSSTATFTPFPTDTWTVSPTFSPTETPTQMATPTVSPTPSPTATPFCTLGWTVGGGSPGNQPNRAFFEQIEIQAGARINAIYADLPSGGQRVVAGVYRSTGPNGFPTTLMVSSALQAAVAGVNLIPLVPTDLTAGWYWIGVEAENGGYYSRSVGCSGHYYAYADHPFGVFPETLPSPQVANCFAFPIWGHFCEPAPPTFTPLPTDSPTATSTPTVTPTATRDSWDAFLDFSTTDNPVPGGFWRYGMTGTLGGPFTVFDTTTGDADYREWLHSATGSSPILGRNLTGSDRTADGGCILLPGATWIHQHPGQAGQYSVTRWTAPETGYFKVDAAFKTLRLCSCPASTDVHILVNGVSVFDSTVGGYVPTAEIPYSGILALSAGDTVDFAVGYNGTWECDSTGMRAAITRSAAPTATMTPTPTITRTLTPTPT